MFGFARSMLLPLAALAGVSLAPAPLSDPIGIYAIIDKVVLSPDDDDATTVQIWGTITMTDGKPGDHFSTAAKGYLYFSLPANARAARAEWADLATLAGKNQIVGFGAHYNSNPRLRCATETPTAPDPYPINIGIVRGVHAGNSIANTIRADLSSGKATQTPCRSRGG